MGNITRLSIFSRFRCGACLALAAVFCLVAATTAGAAFTLEDEQKLGKEIYDKLGNARAIHHDDRVTRYVDDIGRRLLANVDNPMFEYKFSVIRSTAINAFATPGGYIYVNIGLINLVDTESELAGVLAHEIAHVHARHIADSIEKSKKTSMATLAAIILGALAGGGGGGNLGAGIISLGMAAATTVSLQYSREHEEEADRLGMGYLVHTGYDAKAMLDFLKKMRRFEYYSNTIPTYFMTHPGTDERVRYLDASIQTTYTWHGQDTIIGNLRRVQTMLLLGGKDNEKNLRRFRDGLKKHPGNVDDLYGLAVTEVRMGLTREGFAHFEAALKQAPHDPDILADYGISCFKAGDAEGAIRHLTAALTYNSANKEAYLYLGKAFEAKGDTASAIATFEKIGEMPVEDDEFYRSLAMAYGRANRLCEYHINLGTYFKRKNKTESALFHYQAALADLPKGSEKAKDVQREIDGLKKKMDEPRTTPRKSF